MEPTPYRGAGDAARMLTLARQCPADTIHVVDLPYRLSSWALDNPDNVTLWEDGDGRLLAWAIITEGIRRLRALGVDPIEVQTDNYRDNAYAFYQAVGFRAAERLLVYRKRHGPEV